MDAFTRVVPRPMAETEGLVRTALAAHGFGVLTEIDLAATLHAKLGVTRDPIKILGACNPGFADRALTVDPAVSLLLPCNVVLQAVDGGTRVSAVDPRALMGDDEFRSLADEAARELEAALDAVAAD